jgi:hypothetical protein
MRGNTRRCQAENPLIALSSFLEPALCAIAAETCPVGERHAPLFQKGAEAFDRRLPPCRQGVVTSGVPYAVCVTTPALDPLL